MYGYLVEYTNADGRYRTYGGLSHCVEARSQQEAIEKVRQALPSQVAKTYTSITVGGYRP
jgi:hypothetical protein